MVFVKHVVENAYNVILLLAQIAHNLVISIKANVFKYAQQAHLLTL